MLQSKMVFEFGGNERDACGQGSIEPRGLAFARKRNIVLGLREVGILNTITVKNMWFEVRPDMASWFCHT